MKYKKIYTDIPRKLLLFFLITVIGMTVGFVYFSFRMTDKEVTQMQKSKKTLFFEEEPPKVVDEWKTFYTLNYAFDYPEGWGD